MARNTRLWQDPGATSISYEGDVSAGAIWLGYAKAQLKSMLGNTAGPLSATYAPTSSVTIRVDTRPNRIHIKSATGKLFVTIENIFSGPGNYPAFSAPSYNNYRSRFLYKKRDRTSASSTYAGNGYHFASNVINGRPFWSDEKDFAISWVSTSVFIGGRFGIIPLLGGETIVTCFLVSDKTLFIGGGGFKYVVGIIIENTTNTSTLKFYGANTGAPVDLGAITVDDRIDFTYLESRATYQIFSSSTGLIESSVNRVSNFTTDASKIAWISSATVIEVLEFSADYTTVTKAVLNTSVLASGLSFAQRIREEGVGFSFVAATGVDSGIGVRALWVCSLIGNSMSKTLKLHGTVGVATVWPLYFSARFQIALVNVSTVDGFETTRFHIAGAVNNLSSTPTLPADGFDWTGLSFNLSNYAELSDTLIICAPKSISNQAHGYTLVVDTIAKVYDLLDPALDLADSSLGRVVAPVSLTHTKF